MTNYGNNEAIPSSDFGDRLVPIVPEYDREENKYFDKSILNLTPTQWGMIALNSYKGVSITEKQLPSGVYDISVDGKDSKPVFIKKNLVHDKIIPLSGLPSQIVAEIKEFWNKEADFIDLGFLHRRGYLFYGAHGTGKSSLVHEIIDGVIKDGGIVFYCDMPGMFNEGLTAFRQLEPKRKIVCVFEDIDAIIKRYGEAMLLSILDGENQISGVCNLATTNYPELLDKRIVGRPRRFDRVYRIANLDVKARRAYLEKKLPKGADVAEWLTETDGLSIAQISEVIISVFAFKKTLKDAIIIITELARNKSSENGGEKLGFSAD